MPLSTVAKAALCICPPALMAGTVATVPSVKRAVHHLTATHHATKPVHRIAATAAPARQQAVARQPDCDPNLGGGPLPVVPLVTYASPIADEPAGNGIAAPVGAVPVVGALGLGTAGGGGGGVAPVDPGTPVTGSVPEPSIWLMLIAGVGTLGGALRRRRNRAAQPGPQGLAAKATLGGALWSGSAAVEAGDMAATVAMKSAVASAAGKVLLCVCPAAVVAGSVMTVPPLRQAVHAATFTAPAPLPAIANGTLTAQPCAEAMTVPVATMSLDGVPASVGRTPAPAPVAASAAPAVPVTIATAGTVLAGAATDGG